MKAYINDPEAAKFWDLNKPLVMRKHTKILREAQRVFDDLSNAIKSGEFDLESQYENELESIEMAGDRDPQGLCDLAYKIDREVGEYFQPDYVANSTGVARIIAAAITRAYLRVAAELFPISQRISEVILEAVRDNEPFSYDDLATRVYETAEYQAQQNQKPLEKMNRTELLRHLGGLDLAALRRELKI